MGKWREREVTEEKKKNIENYIMSKNNEFSIDYSGCKKLFLFFLRQWMLTLNKIQTSVIKEVKIDKMYFLIHSRISSLGCKLRIALHNKNIFVFPYRHCTCVLMMMSYTNEADIFFWQLLRLS